MVSLTCTGCRAVLQIDDAFVGGVCRCQHCGAIQTVPSNLKKGVTKKKVKTQKTLYRKSVRDEGLPSSGLDQLAQVVSSSGLSSGRLQELAETSRTRTKKGLWMAGGTVAAVAVISGLVWIFAPSTKLDPDSPSAMAASAAIPVEGPQPVLSPNFCGVTIDSAVVIYLLDRGSGTQEWFSHLKEATFKSIESLGSKRKFQILFWDNGGPEGAYPLHAPADATESNIAAARRELDTVFASGQSKVQPALSKAIAAGAEVIMLATGKGPQLDDDFVDEVTRTVQGKSVRIFTFDIASSETSPALRTIARRTGGIASAISETELKKRVRE